MDDLLKQVDDYNTTLNDYTPKITQAITGLAAFGLIFSIATLIVYVVVYLLK
jgi:hypothetical protein